jgi:hypothetical protein
MINVLMGNTLHLYPCFLSQTVPKQLSLSETWMESTQRPPFGQRRGS